MSEQLKKQILLILNHSEAEDGLFFDNFSHLHEEDEREAITANPVELSSALKELVAEKKVEIVDTQDGPIFRLTR